MKTNIYTGPLSRWSDPEERYNVINVSHIRVGGGVIGFVFSAGTVVIFLIGIPALRWFPVGAMLVGLALAAGMRLLHGR